MKTLGLRHVALNVQDPQAAKEFYIRVLKMEVEWEPDPENVYLTTGGHDNLAIHRSPEPPGAHQRLDHLGFALPDLKSVDDWYDWISKQPDAPIVKPIKTHRDGARSFYFTGHEGVLIQMIFHPPIAKSSPVFSLR